MGQITSGQRLKLRDLYVFFTVVQFGSMAKAAAQLGVSQPTVSETIADLEDSYAVRLLRPKPARCRTHCCTGRHCTSDASQRSTN